MTENYEWIFSGVGATIVGLILTYFLLERKKKKEKSSNITINNNISSSEKKKEKKETSEQKKTRVKEKTKILFIDDNHTDFKRDKENLYSTVALDLYTAVLGGEITVATFDGKVKLKIAAGTQNDTKVKLKGKGFPVYKKEGQFGDLYISYQISIPTELSDKEKELFTELSNLRTT